MSGESTALTKEEEKKQPDEEPMDMVVEKQEETDHKNDNQILTEIVEAKMAEELKPMDTDKESIAESKSPEMSMQEDCINDIALCRLMNRQTKSSLYLVQMKTFVYCRTSYSGGFTVTC